MIKTFNNSPLSLSVSSIIFFIVFFLLFMSSGSIIYFTNIPYRPIYVIFIIMPLLFYYRIRLSQYQIYIALFLLVVIISGIFNGMGINGITLYFRYAIVPFLLVYLVDIYFSPQKTNKIIRILIFVGLFQFPVVLIQKIFHQKLIPLAKGSISEPDFYFGTFPWSGDPSMTFFLNCLIILLLFAQKVPNQIKNKIVLSLIFSITIFLSGSDIIRLFNMILWGLFYWKNFRKNIFILFSSIIIVFSTPLFFDNINVPVAISKIQHLGKISETPTGGGTVEEFLSGNYARAAGYYFFFVKEPIHFFGDGPTKYVSPFFREKRLGISGHFLLLYAEIGLLGLFASYMILYKIIFRHKKMNFLNSNKCLRYLFISLVLLSLTSNILNDTSVMLTIAIFSKLFNITQLA